jgi:hypothetical protein
VTEDDEPLDDNDCRSCAHFDDDPSSIEAALPGIAILGSAWGSTRGDAGVCALYRRFHDPIPAVGCDGFERRIANGAAPVETDEGQVGRGRPAPPRGRSGP